MEILAFLRDDRSKLEWLENERLAMEATIDRLSWWPHDKGGGFGVVVSGHLQSMELHLMGDGTVSRHFEKFDPIAIEQITLISDDIVVSTFEEFERIYADLRNRTVASS